MSPAVALMRSVIVAILVLGGFACWLIVLINMFRTVANRRPEIPLFRSWWESPFNILFQPFLLTERGLSARRWCFYGLLGFLGFWLLGALLSFLAPALMNDLSSCAGAIVETNVLT